LFKRIAIPALILILLLASVSAGKDNREGGKGYVTGKVLYKGNPEPGMVVYGFDVESGAPGLASSATPTFIAPVKDDGVFRAEAPEGAYFLVAIKRGQGGMAFGAPMAGDAIYKLVIGGAKEADATITIERGGLLDLGIIEAKDSHAPSMAAPEGAPAGSIAVSLADEEGKPVVGAYVYLFNGKGQDPPDIESSWVIPDFIFGPTDEGGSAASSIPEGDYYYAAIKRTYSPDSFYGPPETDDLFHYQREQLRVRKGRSEAVRAVVHGFVEPEAGEGTFLKGKVVDEDGEPVKGAIVGAYGSGLARGRPLFLSRTRKDGTYSIKFPGGGIYYLRAMVRPGMPAGFYGDVTPVPITVRTGHTVENIDITIAP